MPGALSIDQLAVSVSSLAGGDLSARIVGDGRRTVIGVATLEQADAEHLSFLANPRYRRLAAATGAGALVLSEADRQELFAAGTQTSVLIVCDAAYAWFAFAAQLLSAQIDPAPGCAPSAVVHPGAKVDPSSSIGPLAVIDDGAWIGPRVQVGAGCASAKRRGCIRVCGSTTAAGSGRVAYCIRAASSGPTDSGSLRSGAGG
jgi:UDP-3-O-[3-hydroxymyristoyl] glucosamine N-acyltransferase